MESFTISTYFYDTIELLRSQSSIILHSNFVGIPEDELPYVAEFLEKEFEREAIEYPLKGNTFDKNAALFGAKTIFIAAQLLILRDLPSEDLRGLMPIYEGEISTNQLLSADLCLRFLPDIIDRAEDIDVFDELVVILDEILSHWFYSGIGRENLILPENWGPLFAKSESFQLLFLERVIERNAQRHLSKEMKNYFKSYMTTN